MIVEKKFTKSAEYLELAELFIFHYTAPTTNLDKSDGPVQNTQLLWYAHNMRYLTEIWHSEHTLVSVVT